MLKGFGNFTLKELKELMRDPKIMLSMIVVPLVMFPIMGALINFSMKAAEESMTQMSVVVWNCDGGNYSKEFIANISSLVKIYEINASNITDAVAKMTEHNATELIHIPKGFSDDVKERLENGNLSVRAHVNLYSAFSGKGMLEGASSSIPDYLVEWYNRIQAPNVVAVQKSTIVKGQVLEGTDPSLFSSLMLSQYFTMPFIIMIMLSFAMQIAATSVAMEKEEKTLETLLSLPISRFTILAGKLAGSTIVAAITAAAYILGFNYYMGSITSAVPIQDSIDLAALGITPSTLGYLLLGASIFVTLLSALALAVILSAFAEDVRSAQSLIGFVYPLFFIPALVLMFVDAGSLPLALRMLIYAIPYSHPILTSRAVMVEDYLTATLGIVYVSSFTVVVIYIAAKLFATEKILTAKLKFRGLRRRGKPSVEELQ
ncbi:MAG: ABC transporter permease [Candidatus Bathyarchaeales archaeon]